MDETDLRLELFLEHDAECAESLLHDFGPSLLRRLTVDPTRTEADVIRRLIEVIWVKRPGGRPADTRRLGLDWSAATRLGIGSRGRGKLMPPQDVTEYAAIGMMALLLVQLEGAVIREVLPIGAHADYEIVTALRGNEVQTYRVEVSGMYRAALPSEVTSRVTEKRDQLLKGSSCGFVAVTAFMYPPHGEVHSRLQFVRSQDATGPPAKKAGKRMKPTSRAAGPKNKATTLSSEGAAAMLAGDTDLAREKHTAAGDVLRASLKGVVMTAERHHVRFLAATQYFKAGRYALALEQVRRIEPRLLPPHSRRLFPEFARQVRRRTRRGYDQSTRDRFARHQERNEFSQILSLLHYHPFVFTREAYSFARAFTCFFLGHFEEAGECFAATVRYGESDPTTIMNFACMPYAAISKKGLGLGLNEGWEAACAFTRGFPHATTELVASGLGYQLANSSKGEQRRVWAARQLDFYRSGMAKFDALPAEFRTDPEVQFFAFFMTASAAVACAWLKEFAEASAVADRAELLDPSTGATRGLMTSVREFIRLASSRPHGSDEDVTIPSMEWHRLAGHRGEQAELPGSRLRHAFLTGSLR